jgi:hypothetical protein
VIGIKRQTGEFLPLSYKTSSETNYLASAHDRWLLHGATTLDVSANIAATSASRQPVVADGVMYGAEKNSVVAYELQNPQVIVSKDRLGKDVKRIELRRRWSWDGAAEAPPAATQTGAAAAKIPAITVHVKAGKRLFCSRGSTLFAVDLPAETAGKPQRTWRHELRAEPTSLIVTQGKLIASTKTGALIVFGDREIAQLRHARSQGAKLPADVAAAEHAKSVLQRAEQDEGYCVVFGIGTGRLMDELARQSKFQVIGVDADAAIIEQARKRLDQAGLYGTRVSLVHADPVASGLPPYLANLVIDQSTQDIARGGEAFRVLRPYGGEALFKLSDAQHAELVRTVGAARLVQAEVGAKVASAYSGGPVRFLDRRIGPTSTAIRRTLSCRETSW